MQRRAQGHTPSRGRSLSALGRMRLQSTRFGGRRELSAVLMGLCSHPHPHPAWGSEAQTLVRRPTSGQDSGARSGPAGSTLPPPPAAVFPHLSGPCLVTQPLLHLWSHDDVVLSCFPPLLPSSELSGGCPWFCPQPLAQRGGSVRKDRASRGRRCPRSGSEGPKTFHE